MQQDEGEMMMKELSGWAFPIQYSALASLALCSFILHLPWPGPEKRFSFTVLLFSTFAQLYVQLCSFCVSQSKLAS